MRLRSWRSAYFRRGRASSRAMRRRACVARASERMAECICSLANAAECDTTHSRSSPCTTSLLARARTPGWAGPSRGRSSSGRSRNGCGAWFQGRAVIPVQAVALQLEGVGQRGGTLVHDQGDRLARDAGVIEHAHDALQGLRQGVGIGHIAGIDVVAQAQAVAGVEGVAEADLAQVVALLLAVAAAGQLESGVGGGDPGCGSWWFGS